MSDVFVHDLGLNESSSVGDGTRIWAYAHVMKGAAIGRECNIGESSFVEAGATLGHHVTVKNGVSIWDRVTIGDYAFVGPNAVFTNDPAPRSHPDYRGTADDWRPTHVSEGASIGANATIVCGNSIGAWSLVGAGAVVTRDVAPHAIVVGNPARAIGWACHCGRRLDASGDAEFRCAPCDATYVLDGGAISCPERAEAPRR